MACLASFYTNCFPVQEHSFQTGAEKGGTLTVKFI